MSKYIEDGITARAPFLSENLGGSSSSGGGGSLSGSSSSSSSTSTTIHNNIAVGTTTTTTLGSANNKIRSAETKAVDGSDQAEEEQQQQQLNPKPSLALMKLKTYLTALRPWSLSASLVPTLLGSAIAYRTSGIHDFNVVTLVLTIFTIISVHCAGNVVNTYFDFVKGIDNRKSDDRTLVDHILTKDEVSKCVTLKSLHHSSSSFSGCSTRRRPVHGRLCWFRPTCLHITCPHGTFGSRVLWWSII